MELIGIVDSGSTKSDFVFVNTKGEVQLCTKTMGFNPLFVDAEKITAELHQNSELKTIADRVVKLFFYGAGVRSAALKNSIQNPFSVFFENAEILVESDMMAAVYAAFGGEPTMVCILGTGSNACFFDGKTITKDVPSLGFILGDEGSGNHLGRLLLQAYFTKKLPENLSKAFQEKYQLLPEELLENVYKKPNVNAYLAKFSEFIAEHQNDGFIRNLIKKSFKEFIAYQVLPYPQAQDSELNFIGSIAFYYQDILAEVVAEVGLKFGCVIQKPIDALVDYHVRYLF